MTIHARNLSTRDMLVYDEIQQDMYIIPASSAKSGDDNLIQYARHLTQQGVGLHLDKHHVNQLKEVTQRISILS
jgi:hypothetical protein